MKSFIPLRDVAEELQRHELAASRLLAEEHHKRSHILQRDQEVGFHINEMLKLMPALADIPSEPIEPRGDVEQLLEEFDREVQSLLRTETVEELDSRDDVNTDDFYWTQRLLCAYAPPEFSARECGGRYLDLEQHYESFLATRVRRASQAGGGLVSSSESLSYTQFVAQFATVFPSGPKAVQYAQNLFDYLVDFLRRTQPFLDIDSFLTQIHDEFANSAPFFCEVCDKHFASQGAFDNHFGKKHNKLAKVKDHRSFEFHTFAIARLAVQLERIVEETRALAESEEARLLGDLLDMPDAEEVSESSDDDAQGEAPLYNPKKLPLGWDGQPIAYWAWKYHGLNHSFKCEICGDAIYKGFRAFEVHFKEHRHSYGLECLGIPPGLPELDGITSISGALTVYAKIQERAKSTWDPSRDAEFEDAEGNTYDRQTYLMLKSQLGSGF